jgi:two-component system, OmpR family, phosphate regulon response regulator PhoB
MAKILLIDDDADLAEVLQVVLQSDGHKVEICNNGPDALQILSFSKYDLLVMDWELGDSSGPDICNKFRSDGGAAPVLMITGRGDKDSKIEGLDKGCDDYLVKPFDFEEFTARVRALLRRVPIIQSEQLDYHGLTILTREAKLLHQGIEIKIKPLELRILELLVRHKGQWFKPDDLLSRAWPANSSATVETVRVSINRLRGVLEPFGLLPHLQSARNLGYRLE